MKKFKFFVSIVLISVGVGVASAQVASGPNEIQAPLLLSEQERKELLEAVNITREMIERAMEVGAQMTLEEAESHYRFAAGALLPVSAKAEPKLELLSRAAIQLALALTDPGAPFGQTMSGGFSGYMLEQAFALAREFLPREEALFRTPGLIHLPYFDFAIRGFASCMSAIAMIPELPLAAAGRRICVEKFARFAHAAPLGDQRRIAAVLLEVDAWMRTQDQPEAAVVAGWLERLKPFGVPASVAVLKRPLASPPSAEPEKPKIPLKLRDVANHPAFRGTIDVALGASNRSGFQGDISANVGISGNGYANPGFHGNLNAAITLGADQGKAEYTRAQVRVEDLGASLYGSTGVSALGLSWIFGEGQILDDRRLGLTLFQGSFLMGVGAHWRSDTSFTGDDRLRLTGDLRVGPIGGATGQWVRRNESGDYVQDIGGKWELGGSVNVEVSYTKRVGPGSVVVGDRFWLKPTFNAMPDPLLQVENHATLGWSPDEKGTVQIRTGYLLRNAAILGQTGAQNDAFPRSVTDHFLTFGVATP